MYGQVREIVDHLNYHFATSSPSHQLATSVLLDANPELCCQSTWEEAARMFTHLLKSAHRVETGLSHCSLHPRAREKVLRKHLFKSSDSWQTNIQPFSVQTIGNISHPILNSSHRTPFSLPFLVSNLSGEHTFCKNQVTS